MQVEGSLENRIRRAFGLKQAKSNYRIVVEAYYAALSSQDDHGRAYDAALTAYCRNNDASPADRFTRIMVGVLIDEAGFKGRRIPSSNG